MNRLIIQLAIAALLCVGFSRPAAAGGSRLAKAMGDLRWGMSESDVTRYLQRRLKAHYRKQAQQASGIRKTRLEREGDTRAAAVSSSLVEFKGRPTKWDRGLIAHEFTHGNGESMLVARDSKSTNYYFFINGSLWKWYKAFEPGALGTGSFKVFAKEMEGRFGTGYQKTVERARGQGERDVVEWRDRNTRLHAVDESEHRRFCLVFEDASTLRDLAGLRTNPDKRFARVSAKRRRAAPRRQTLAAPVEDDSVETAGAPTPVKSKGKRRSVFDSRRGPETDAEYEKRRDRELKKQMRRQRNKYNAELEKKRAKALEGLKGLEQDDPLGGL